MLGTSWECHKVREFALRPMGDFLLVLDLQYLVGPTELKRSSLAMPILYVSAYNRYVLS